MQEPVEVRDPTTKKPSLKLVRERGGRSADVKTFARAQWRVLVVLGTLGLGVLFVTLGWYGTAHTNIITEQIPYLISGGLLGLGLIIISGFMAYAFMMERQTEELRRDIARALAQPRAAAGAPVATGETTTPPVAGDGVFVAPGGRSYHFAGCPMVEGKDGVRSLSAAKAMAEGYAACKLCSSD